MKTILSLLVALAGLSLHAKQVEFYLAPVTPDAAAKSVRDKVKSGRDIYYLEKIPRISGADIISCELVESDLINLPIETHKLRFKLTPSAALRYNQFLESGENGLVLMVDQVPVLFLHCPFPKDSESPFYRIMRVNEETGTFELGLTPAQEVIKAFK